MYYDNQTIKAFFDNEHFFCFELKNGDPVIFDYQYLDKEISILPDSSFSLTEKAKQKEKVDSIDAMRKKLCKIIAYLLPPLQGFIINISEQRTELNININMNDVKLIANQIIFDILYDEYLKNSPRITLNEYCTKYIPYDWDDSIYDGWKELKDPEDKISLDWYHKCFKAVLSKYTKVKLDSTTMAQKILETKASSPNVAHSTDKDLESKLERCIDFIKEELDKKKDAIFHAMVRQMELDAEIMEHTELKKQVRQLGVNPDLRIEYYNERNKKGKRDVKKPKYIWDSLYFNGCPNFITSKQYKRIWEKDSNYSYAKFIEDYNNYDKFVEFILPNNDDKNCVYIQKCMYFYNLEIYKRLDFVYKLALKMESENVSDVNKAPSFVKRFHPIVVMPYVEDNQVKFHKQFKYYKPIIFMEEKWMEQYPIDAPNLCCMWQTCHLLRAKAYELFKYHYEFRSDDYESIADFLRTDYNLEEYHVKDKKWDNPGKSKLNENRNRISNVLKINKTLFRVSEERLPIRKRK
ncbi:MAG: hypothetical protein HFI90_06715 [Clostridia bacterium]|nr:hypothetical protein [Clostridia bacterium]